MNCQHINNKRCELQTATGYIKPDIIIGDESWLAPKYANSEIFQEEFNGMDYRKDRKQNCGVIFISVRDGCTTSKINQGSSNWEIVWKELQSRNEKSVVLDSFYISPNTGLETLQELRKSLENLPKNSEEKDYHPSRRF